MKKIKKNKYFIPIGNSAVSDKKHIHALVILTVALLALSVLLCGSVISFAKAMNASDSGSGISDDISDVVKINAEISEEIKLKIEEFDNSIKEKDSFIKDIENQISECTDTPEDKLYVEELYDRQIKAVLDKYEMCGEYSALCIKWSEETRLLLDDSIAEYEKYLTYYKDRLSVNYEVGTPDQSKIFSTSETIIEFITGQAILEELKIYDESLRIKVEELYAEVSDGLGVVKYYITKADEYSRLALEAYDDFKVFSEKAIGYLADISFDKDVYNYYLSFSAENQQKLTKQLTENISKYSGLVSGKVGNYLWPLSSEFFYTDYIGSGHESKYEWSSVLGKYINIFKLRKTPRRKPALLHVQTNISQNCIGILNNLIRKQTKKADFAFSP